MNIRGKRSNIKARSKAKYGAYHVRPGREIGRANGARLKRRISEAGVAELEMINARGKKTPLYLTLSISNSIL